MTIYKEEEFLIDQSTALTEVVKDSLVMTKQHLNRMCIILVISILVNLLLVFGFLWYESQFEYTESTVTETETITTTQTVDGENSCITNIGGNQYNDSTHNEGSEN